MKLGDIVERNIRARMGALKVSGADICGEAGYASVQGFNKRLRNTDGMTIADLERIAKSLAITPSELVSKERK